MGEETVEIPGVLLKDRVYEGKKFEPGTKFIYHCYVAPAARNASRKLALYVLLEYTPEIMCPMFSSFMDEGLIPPGFVVFLYPARWNRRFAAANPATCARRNSMNTAAIFRTAWRRS